MILKVSTHSARISVELVLRARRTRVAVVALGLLSRDTGDVTGSEALGMGFSVLGSLHISRSSGIEIRSQMSWAMGSEVWTR